MALRLEGSDKYNPQRLDTLEAHVAQQVANGTYDLDANLALLRLYNCEPGYVKLATLANVLLLALMRLPEPDFTLVLHLIPDSIQDNQAIAAIISLDRHLESFRFSQFWQEVDSAREVLNKVSGFYDAVRQFIVHSLSTTFSSLPKSMLSQSLKADGTSLDNLIADKIGSDGWSIGADNIIRFPKQQVREVKPQAEETSVQLEKLVPVVSIRA